MKRRFELKAIYDYTKDHLSQWSPKLPSYQAFCYRLNRLAPALQSLAEIWMDKISAKTGTEMTYVVDSCPVILAKQKRSSHAKIAPELCDKGYNSSRDEYYYGVKLHTFMKIFSPFYPKARGRVNVRRPAFVIFVKNNKGTFIKEPSLSWRCA